MKKLQDSWQQMTGEEDTPFDGDSTAFVASLIFHLCLLVVLGMVPLLFEKPEPITITTVPLEEVAEDLSVAEEFYFSDQPAEEVGSNSVDGIEMALSLAPIESDISEIPNPVEMDPVESATIEINNAIEAARGLHFSENLVVRGAAGEGVTGATGAIDRITHEILLSLEERKTLVVWLFDQSGSLYRQRQELYNRFDKIYEELGVIEAAGNPAFAKHKDKPLLTSVVAFGNKVTLRTPKPTDNLAEIKEAVSSIELDSSGTEQVFSAIYMAADEYKDYRVPSEITGEPERNVMLIALTDEAGDDQKGLDHTVRICRRYEIPVYCVGVPAPFGRQETMVKWVDPDPKFDQSPQWGRVMQGPESFLPERVKLHFAGTREDKDPIDSGFGPFALTRLCVETGGIYFTVHPNRNVNRAVSRRETAAFSAHIEHFFDPERMRKYRPDYVTAREYTRRSNANRARASLVKAAQMSWIAPMDSPKLTFVKRDEATLANELTEAQKQAAKLEPRVRQLVEVLKLGEEDRDKEFTPRWQAGYDLAYGRTLAVQVRTEAYNAMLAKAKRGLKFENAKNNTWVLTPSDEVSVGSQLGKSATKAREFLNRVAKEHPNTPWALLAKRELATPMGWTWKEQFTDLSPRRNNAGGGGNPRPPRNDQKRMLNRPPPKRKAPKL